jgi:tetratricopeptide (TPR) repeat protein
VYSSLRPVKDGVAVGDLIPGRMQVLGQGSWLDFETLTSVRPGSPIYNEGDRTGLFYGESWAFTHMLFLAPDYKDNFGKFVMALHRGSSAAEACQIAYGKSSTEVFGDLRKYFDRKKIFGAVYKTTLAKAEAEPVVEKVSDLESRLALADLQASIGHSELAKREYDELEKLQPAQPDLEQSLGYFALSRQNTPQAREHFERAFAAGNSDPQMCLTLASMENDAKQPPAKVIPILERAVQSKPDYADALLQLGVLRVATRQFEGGISALMSIQNVTPERATGLFFALAYAYLQTGDLDRARENALTAKKWSKSPEQVKQLANVLDFVEARAKLPTPPHPGEKLQSVKGLAQSIDCATGGNRLRLQSGQKDFVFILPDPKAIEFTSVTGGTLNLRCGPQKPFNVMVEYAPVSVMEQGITGVVRRLDF